MNAASEDKASSSSSSTTATTRYDAHAKEAELRAASEAWDTTTIRTAQDDDIPLIDLSETNNTDTATIVQQLRHACTKVGFYYLKGHGISPSLREETFAAIRDFYNLPRHVKETLRMDRPEFPVGGVGYLPYQNRKLPSRKKGNANEAFIVKRQSGKTVNIRLQDNQWPGETVLPGFQGTIMAYADAMEQLALKKLLPLYAAALDLDPSFFDEAFSRPMYRLRMTKYPPVQPADYQADDEFGIAPHVDTSFLTILDQDGPGLVIYSEQQQCWLKAPLMDGALIVNTGELLRQWTNDVFVSVKHFANNSNNNNNNNNSVTTTQSQQARYSIPFFFNANADYRMHCIPTCCCSPPNDDSGDDNGKNPPKYPPFSYEESQAIAQGE